LDDRVTEPLLRLQDVRYRYPGATNDALQGVSLAVAPKQFHAVLGPNGSGKTTLVRIALGGLKPLVGRADVIGVPASHWPRQDLARLVGVVPQREDNLFPQRVRETVLLGRYPHLSLWGRERAADHDAVDRALAACDALHLANRWLWTLSGGEYQRVRVARALAQEPKLLVLDEPGMSLDLKHEMGLFELVLGLVHEQGLGVLMITHDLNLAARFADSLLLLEGGRPVAAGAPNDVLTQETVAQVFSWPVAMHTVDGRPQMVPLRQPKESRA
jgi:iron complex transport system ATP-binding protein